MKIVIPIIAAALAAQAAFAQPPGEQAPNADAAPADDAAPVVTDPELRIDGPPTEMDVSYETSVLGAFRVTQGAQGSLDGRWHVTGADGAALYTLQLTDPGAGESRIEGAWKNLAVTGPGASGFIETVRREGDDVVFTFRDGPREIATELRLRMAPNGVWTGEATADGRRTGVLANRGQGVETAAMAVPEWRPPPPPKPKAQPKRKSRSKAKSKRRR